MTAQSAAVRERIEETEIVKHSNEEISNQFSQIYDAVARRAFEIFVGRGCSPGRELEDWLRAESELLHPVPLKVTESNGKYIVRAEVPGFSSRDIKVIVEPRYLAISGKREMKEEVDNAEMIRFEWSADQIFRALDLPSEVDTSNFNTNVKDGILTVDLPKAQNTNKGRVERYAA